MSRAVRHIAILAVAALGVLAVVWVVKRQSVAAPATGAALAMENSASQNELAMRISRIERAMLSSKRMHTESVEHLSERLDELSDGQTNFDPSEEDLAERTGVEDEPSDESPEELYRIQQEELARRRERFRELQTKLASEATDREWESRVFEGARKAVDESDGELVAPKVQCGSTLCRVSMQAPGRQDGPSMALQRRLAMTLAPLHQRSEWMIEGTSIELFMTK